MSFRDRRENKAELRPPDAKRSKGDRPISPAVAQNSNIPVFERRKMFEQTDSGLCVEKPAVGSSGKRRLTVKSQIGRSGSFRGSKKFKGEGDGSPQLRARQISGASLPLSQRLRYFGHYDLQSAAIERLTSEKALTSDHAVKKATGASAAHGAREEESGDGVSNDLVAACPAFKNEVGGDSDWLDENNPVLRLRSYLSHDKQKRIASREGYILDGDIPGKEAIGARGPPSRQASEVFQRQSELYFPLEFIDYGAAYYRNYFLGHGAHIRAIRGKFQGFSGGVYDHHMLVIEVVSETAIRVIHYTGGVENRDKGETSGFTSATSFSVLGIGRGGEGTGVIAEEVINVKPEDLKCLELLQYTDDVTPFPPDKSIQRARERLNERNYGVFHNNCECFVNWAVIDKAISYQVVDGAVASVKGAAKGAKERYDSTGGSMVDAIAGGFQGLFIGYQEHREKRQ